MRDDEHLRWKELSRRRVTSHSLFDLHVAERTSTTGARGEFLILSAPDWVNVVAVVTNAAGEDCFLMVRQYRHGANVITTEFPAGLVEPGEDPREAAERELREETGYRAGRMTLIGRVSPNPAFMTNWCSTYLAEELRRVGEKSLDELEQLETVLVPVALVGEKIGTGELINSLVTVAYLWYTRSRAAGSP
ncbi:MAG TPA: NUDIX hydrolase [Spirochaetia bacterium]|nr:NUDIX hydrolase [Spirochaetia bacterium]